MENHSEDDLTELLAGFTIPYKKELFSEYVQTDFDGASLMMVKDYMGYLETRYGRREFYRERRPDDLPHHLVYVNCDLPYREYGEDVISLDKKVIMDEY